MIDCQPTNEDLNQLTGELTKATASIPTTNGGGQHGLIEIIIPDAKYLTVSNGGAHFLVPTNPGLYPTIVDPNQAVRKHQDAKHKADFWSSRLKIALRNASVKCFDEEWIKELRSETMGYMHCPPHEILGYLYRMGGDLDHMEIAEAFETMGPH
ncbi:hypothetical protein ACHAW6_011650 [Cyclotella cf. meneghiniana]